MQCCFRGVAECRDILKIRNIGNIIAIFGIIENVDVVGVMILNIHRFLLTFIVHMQVMNFNQFQKLLYLITFCIRVFLWLYIHNLINQWMLV